MALRQNALILLLLTGLVAIAGDWSGEFELARFWYLPAALLLLGLAYERWMASRAAPELQINAPPRWFLGRATAIHFLIGHRLARALTLELAPGGAPEISMDRSIRTISAAAERSTASAAVATARRLGIYPWPAMRIRIGGVLGLAWWPQVLKAAGGIRVVPEILREPDRMPGIGRLAGLEGQQRMGSGAEVQQLREYQQGDPPRAIDWKASARSRRLISRDFSEDQQLDIVLAVDAGRASALAAGDTDRLALYANVAARLAQRAASLDDRVGLVVYAERPLAALAPSHGEAAVTRVRAVLSDMSVQPVDSNPALAAVRIRSLAHQRCLVVLLTDLDDASMTGELRTALRLLLPKHLPFVAGVASPRVQALGSARATYELDVYRSLAAQEYSNTLRQNVMSLRALGAAAVLATPERLDRAVLNAYWTMRQRRRI
ncbi:MAG TPA: DUF58 domain-containing protein [Steroidobacteraceae bacterium]|jgi:uncharacterized protein (DUF58 family)|nr:DUF58 domain-containing protein [Steroidobacteraceae bacterium]